MEVEIINNYLSFLFMINMYIEAGKLVSQACIELRNSRRDIKVADVLITKGIVGSAPALSWIRQGRTKDILRYVRVLYEVTKLLPPERRDRYRLEMFEVMAVVDGWWEIVYIRQKITKYAISLDYLMKLCIFAKIFCVK